MADEPSLNFKFSLDLSDFDKAPKIIDDALQHIASQAEAQGKNADMAMAKWVQDMIKERESRVAELTKQIEDATRAYAETFANFQNGKATYEDWQKSYDALDKLKAELSQTKDELNLLNEKENEVAGNASFLTQLKMKAQGMDLYGKAMSMLPAPISNVIQSTKGLDKALKGLLANPVVLFLSALVVVIKSLYGWFDGLADRNEKVAYVFGVVTGAVGKVIDAFNELINLNLDGFLYNLKTMFDGGEREIAKRNEDLRRVEEQGLRDRLQRDNQFLRKRMNNTKLDMKDRLEAEKQYTANLKQIEETRRAELERKMTEWSKKNGLRTKDNPEGWATDISQLAGPLQVELREMYNEMARIDNAIEDITEESKDRIVKFREEAHTALETNLKALEDQLKARKQYQRQVRESIEAENRRLQSLARSNEYSAMENIINDMADGIEKSSRQAELKMKQSLDQLNDAIYAEAQQLYNNEKTAFERNPNNEGKLFKAFVFGEYETQAKANIDADGKEKAINSNYQRELQRLYDAQIKQFQTYADKRTEIERQASEQRLAFEKKGMKNSEQAQLAELDRIKKLFAVDLEEWQNGTFIQTALDNISSLSKESLAVLEKEIDKFELDEAMKGVISDDTARQFDELREKIEEALIPYQSLGDAIQQAKNAQEALNKARENGDPLEIAKAETKVVKSMQVLQDKMSQYGEAIARVGSALRGLGDQIGGTVGEILNLIGMTTDIVKSVGDGIVTISKGATNALEAIEMASVILEIISLIMQFTNAIKDMMDMERQSEIESLKGKQKLIDIYRELSVSVGKYKQALIDARYEKEKLFAPTNIGSMIINMEKLAEAQKSLQKERLAMAEMSSKTIIASKKYGEDPAYRQAINNGLKVSEWDTSLWDIGGIKNAGIYGSWTDLITVYTKGVGTQLLSEVLKQSELPQLIDKYGKLDMELMDNIKTNNTELWDSIDEEDRKRLERLYALQKDANELQKELTQEMASWYSPLLDNMTDAWMNWLNTGEGVMDKFKEYSSDTFSDILKDVLKKKLFDTAFDSFFSEIDTLTDDYLHTGDDDEYAKQVAIKTQNLMDKVESNSDIYEKAMTAYTEALREKGIDITGEMAGRNAEARGIARASQESVDENNARLAMMQQHTYTINANVAQLVQTSSQMLMHLQGIHTNTNELSRLAKIESSLANIETYGIRTR